MIRHVVIENGIVVNAILADSADDAEKITGLLSVFSDMANIGDTYDAETGLFSAPVIVEPPVAVPLDPELAALNPVEESPAE